jgi:hypothetical protein
MAYGKGLVVRSFRENPVGKYCAAFPFAAMANSEIDDRIALMEIEKATLLDVRGSIPSTDQGSQGYCWAHSTVSAMLLLRAKQGLPYVELSAYSVAAPIKHFKNEGGWCQESMDWITTKGCASSATWPIQSMSRDNVTTAMREESLLYRVTEWYDGGDDPKLFWTAVAMGFPVVSDFNDWGHSVCTIAANRKNNTGLIWNSWGDSWGNKGVGVPQARSCVPNNWMVPRVSTS